MTENERSGFEFEEIPLRDESLHAPADKEPVTVQEPAAEETIVVPPVIMEHESAETEQDDMFDEPEDPVDSVVEELIVEAASEPDEEKTVIQQPEEDPDADLMLPDDDDPPAPAGEDTAAPADEENEENPVEERTKWRMPGFLKFLLWLVVTLGAGLGLAYFGWICAGDVFALSKPDREVEITIEEGDTMNDVIEMLVEEDLVEYEWLFRIYCVLANAKEKYSVGTFTLNNLYDYNALVKGLQAYSGSRETTHLKIPEGCTSAEVFALLEEAGVCTVERLEYAAANYEFDYSFLQDLPYGNSNRLEGYLYPDTYEFYIDDAAERVLSKLMDNFSWKFEEELRLEIDSLNQKLAQQMRENGFTDAEIAASELTLHDVVIVASLIESESSGVSERALIASVIYNRLASKVYPLLEIESALRYGLNKWEGELTASDRGSDSPYNTNRYPGLPVGPIGNPTVDSIRAALFPKDSNYYFYAMSKSGYHYFFETYYEHQDFLKEMEAGNDET